MNLDHGGYRSTAVADGVLFDMDADGVRDLTAWTDPSVRQAFLALDRNGSRQIDDGSELFGSNTWLPDGSRAANGFAALAGFDSNGDVKIDARDAVWPVLLAWVDENHDGISQPTELFSLDELGIAELSLDAVWTGRRDVYGNLFAYRAAFRTIQRPVSYYDVYLRGR